MELFVDNKGQQFISSKAAPVRVDQVRLPENDIDPIIVWLLDRPDTAGLPLIPGAIPTPFTGMVVSARPTNDLEEDNVLFSVTDFTLVGEGDTLHYEGLLHLDTPEMQAALVGRKTLEVFLEVELTKEDGSRARRLTPGAKGLAVRDIWRGTEPEETFADPAYPVPNSVVVSLNAITGLTGGGATNMDGLTTAATRSPGYEIHLYIASEPQAWRLRAGTDAENSAAGIVRPDDYDAGTNAKIWERIG